MDDAVRVDELVVDRGGLRVLSGIDLRVAPGTVTGLLGPSGSGKTTLMRAVVGVQRITAGNVEVFGLPAGSAALRRRVGYVTQKVSVYPDLSARDNLRYFAAIHGVPRRAEGDALETVGLQSAAGQPVGRMSGGEQARVSLACALLASPELLVLDEPTVGLDPVLRRDLWAGFHRLAAAGTTLLVSSHVMDEAARCDRLVLLRQGHVVAEGTPQGIMARTGEPDLEAAFLHLAEAGEVGVGRAERPEDGPRATGRRR